MTPKVSFVVPVWNVEPYLKDCLDSLLNQTFDEYEVIIVYDVSQDNSLEICKQYESNPKVHLIIRETNKGHLVGARNVGIKQACGEYICLIDSDDIIHEDLLKITYNAAISNDAEVVFFDAKMFRDKAERWELQFDYSDAKSEFSLRCLKHKEILRGYYMGVLSGSAFASLRKKSIYDDYDAYYYKDQACEATLQAIPMITRIKSAYYLPIDLYKFRVDRPGSIRYGLDYSARVLREFTDVYIYRLGELDKLPEDIIASKEKNQCAFEYNQVMAERYLRYQEAALYSMILSENPELKNIKLIFFFGVSENGIRLTNMFKFTGIKILFCDSDKKRHGDNVNGINVISPDMLREQYNKHDCRLFITSRYILEISEKLLESKVIDTFSSVMPFYGQTGREKCFEDLFEQYMSLNFFKANRV